VERRALLAGVDIFQGLRPSELEALLQLTSTRSLAAGETLFYKGDPGDQLYGVLRGRLKVLGSGADGRELVFALLEAGEVVGEVALLDAKPRSGTVVALEASEVLGLHRRNFLPFLEAHPRVAIRLAEVLAARLRRLSEHVEDALFLSLPSRLAKKLLALARAYGQPAESGVRIDLKLRQQALAELVGASRESVNKQLRAWARDGWLRLEGGYVTLLEPERLRAAAQLLSGS